ncbi:hypothetical protein ACMZ5E_33005, partial [Streptomyces rhizosphaericola]
GTTPSRAPGPYRQRAPARTVGAVGSSSLRRAFRGGAGLGLSGWRPRSRIDRSLRLPAADAW